MAQSGTMKTIIFDDVVKAEAMNDHFTTTGPTLASKIYSAEGFIDMTHLYKVSPQFHKFYLMKTSY